jgi:hypothetical protein
VVRLLSGVEIRSLRRSIVTRAPPMWWPSGPSGDRRADQWIRKQYQIGSRTVQTTNSLRGACLVQGALFAERARQLFPAVPITEAHPKAVLQALGHTWSEFCSAFSIKGIAENEHRHASCLPSPHGKDLKGPGRLISAKNAMNAGKTPLHIGWLRCTISGQRLSSTSSRFGCRPE